MEKKKKEKNGYAAKVEWSDLTADFLVSKKSLYFKFLEIQFLSTNLNVLISSPFQNQNSSCIANNAANQRGW